MNRAVPLLLVLLILGCRAEVRQPAEWTIMMWLNGDNSLQEAIVSDWKEAASVRDSDAVHVVVQLDRFQPAGTHRFRVQHSNEPRLDPKSDIGERNMVSGDELADFICWATKKYPARRYALIIGSHGNGPRFFKYTRRAQLVPLVPLAPGYDDRQRPDVELPDGVLAPPTRAISADASEPTDMLHTAEIAQSLQKALRNGPPIHLLGFDACLMSMVENAYALRDAARVMVASEELVAEEGWSYGLWLARLVEHPTMDERELAAVLVDSFKQVQRRNDRTLAAYDLSHARELGKALSALSAALMSDMKTQKDVIRRARAKCEIFARGKCGSFSCFHHIDLLRFTSLVATDGAATPGVRSAAERVMALLCASRIDHYAGPARASNDPAIRDFGAQGLAIFFPETKKAFTDDLLMRGVYVKKSKVEFPIEFVEKEAWSDLLHAYYAALGQ